METQKTENKNLKVTERIFGQELILDLYDCDPQIIRSGKKLVEYCHELCKVIEMKPYGKPFLERFALHSDFASGYSVAQMIETSLISGHFSELWNRAYINIFSCKTFDHEVALNFSKEFFKAKEAKNRVLIR